MDKIVSSYSKFLILMKEFSMKLLTIIKMLAKYLQIVPKLSLEWDVQFISRKWASKLNSNSAITTEYIQGTVVNKGLDFTVVNKSFPQLLTDSMSVLQACSNKLNGYKDPVI